MFHAMANIGKFIFLLYIVCRIFSTGLTIKCAQQVEQDKRLQRYYYEITGLSIM